MHVLSQEEINKVSGGMPKLLNVVAGAVFGAITGVFVAGPAGLVAGAYMGASGALIKEAGYGLAELGGQP